MLTLYRAPFSTNVERVALALAHKCLEVESVTVNYTDRGDVVRVSGQPLVPVLVDDGTVVWDSSRIIEYLEKRYPEPPLFPAEGCRRAEMRLFVDWFNRVWKPVPNQIEAELATAAPDRARIAALAAELQGHLEVFAALVDGRDYLLGDAFSAADCAVFPFLKYARGRAPGDDELFHRILDENQSLGHQHAGLRRWIERVDALPRA